MIHEMGWANGPDDVKQRTALGSVGWSRIGRIRYYFADDRWEWSDEVERMYGYAPGAIEPTTELVMCHTHLEDRQEVAKLLQTIRRTWEAFSNWHRICDTSGHVRHVAVIGDQLRDDSGQVIGSEGFCIDLTGDIPSIE